VKLAPYRAAGRIAWRQARRSPWRSALIVAMVAMPIGALSFAGVVIRTAQPTPQEYTTGHMGHTEIEIDGWSGTFDPPRIRRILPDGTRLITVRNDGTSQLVGGSLLYLNLEEASVPVDDPALAGMFQVVEGRAPHAPGEVAVDPRTLHAFKARVGGPLDLTGQQKSLKVVGAVIRPEEVSIPTAILGPRTLEPDPSGEVVGTWFVDVPVGTPVRQVLDVLSRDPSAPHMLTRAAVAQQGMNNDDLRATGASFGATVVALFGTCLVAAAAFRVGARRQLRSIGLVGAAGADPRHVRAMVLTGGVLLGLVGAVAGILLGIIGALAVSPYLDRLVGRVVGQIEVPISVLAGALLLGTLAATMAAYGPARSAARVSTVDALASRSLPPRPPGRLARRGLVAVAAGIAIVAFATAARQEKVLGAGLVVMLTGFLLAIPLLVEWVGKVAGLLPTTARLAARETARYGRRTGPAIAAATLALALPVAVSAYTLSEEALEARNARLGPDHLLVGGFDVNSGRSEPPPGLLRELRSLFPGSIVASLRPAVFTAGSVHQIPPGQQDWAAFVEGGTRTLREGIAYRENGMLMIGTPDLLRALHAENGIPALVEGEVVAIGRGITDRGTVLLHLPPDSSGEEGQRTVRAVEVDAPTYYNETVPRFLVSARGASRMGMVPGAAQETLFRARGSLTEEHIRRAKEAASRYPGAFIFSARDYLPNAAPYRAIATGGSGVIALAIVAVAVALVAAESKRDHAIMVAVGAEPHARRKVVGITAFLVAGLAAVLAVPAGFLPIAVVQAVRRAPYPVVTPWLTMALVVGTVPLVAGALAALASRRPKAIQMLQPAW
jgi:putative ABC transport system permease protein